MNEERCIKCNRDSNQVRLFDGIYVSESVKICERCSLIAGIPIIKKPSADQLKDSEKPWSVHSRLSRLAGLDVQEKKKKSAYEELTELEAKPELERPDEMKFQLVDNFHWIIQTNRRRKGLSAKQLADSISESEAAIKMLEGKSVPRDSLQLIQKIEQFLGIRLIKEDSLKSTKDMNIQPAPSLLKDEIERRIDIDLETDKPMLPFERKQKEKSQALPPAIASIPKVSNLSVSHDEVKKKEFAVYGKRELKTRGEIPSIHDLARMKREKEKTSIIGKDIEFEEQNKEKLSKEEWDDLE